MRINKTVNILGLLSCMLLAGNIHASARLPSNDTPEPSTPVQKHADVVCKCDPTDDPCCIPPIGTSSKQKTDSSTMLKTDVAKCKCDVDTDPCCKRLPGTEKAE